MVNVLLVIEISITKCACWISGYFSMQQAYMLHIKHMSIYHVPAGSIRSICSILSGHAPNVECMKVKSALNSCRLICLHITIVMGLSTIFRMVIPVNVTECMNVNFALTC